MRVLVKKKNNYLLAGKKITKILQRRILRGALLPSILPNDLVFRMRFFLFDDIAAKSGLFFG